MDGITVANSAVSAQMSVATSRANVAEGSTGEEARESQAEKTRERQRGKTSEVTANSPSIKGSGSIINLLA